MPALAFSLLLVAVGLILALAIDATVAGIDIVAIGVILAAVGGFGVLLSMLYMMSVLPWGGSRRVVDEPAPTHDTHDRHVQ